MVDPGRARVVFVILDGFFQELSLVYGTRRRDSVVVPQGIVSSLHLSCLLGIAWVMTTHACVSLMVPAVHPITTSNSTLLAWWPFRSFASLPLDLSESQELEAGLALLSSRAMA